MCVCISDQILSIYPRLYRVLYSVYSVYCHLSIPHPSVISRTTFRGQPTAPRLYLLSGWLQLHSPLDRTIPTAIPIPIPYTPYSTDMDIPLNQQPNHPSTVPKSTLNAQPSAAASASTSMLTSNPAAIPSTTQTYTSDIQPQTQPSVQCQMQAQSQSQPSERPSDIPTTVPAGTGSDPAAAAAAVATEYPHQIQGMGGPTATAPFLQDFSLVAEAAKRAQMAVVMRDMEGISL